MSALDWPARLRSAWRRRLVSGPTRFRDRHGLTYLLEPTDDVELYRRHHGWFEEAEQAFVVRHLRPGMTAVDVGAYIGVYTCLMARLVGPGGRVHAFEPSTTSFARLCRHVELNGLANVVANRQAVAGESGRLALRCYPPPFESLSSLVRRELVRSGRAIPPMREEPVEAVSLDDYAARAGLGRIDLLKLDAEGAELRILRGCRRLLAREAIRALLIEVNDDVARILAELRAAGFRFFTPTREGALEPTTTTATARAATNLVALHVADRLDRPADV